MEGREGGCCGVSDEGQVDVMYWLTADCLELQYNYGGLVLVRALAGWAFGATCFCSEKSVRWLQPLLS